MTVVRWKRKKTVPTLPNVPHFILGGMAKHPRYLEPEEEWEWEIDIYRRTYNLCADDSFDVLKKLPSIPSNPILPKMVPQDALDDDDDDREAWTCEIYRCNSNLASGSKSAMDSVESLNQRDEMGLPVLAGLPDLSLNQSKEMGLPDLAGLPDIAG